MNLQKKVPAFGKNILPKVNLGLDAHCQKLNWNNKALGGSGDYSILDLLAEKDYWLGVLTAGKV